MEHVVGDLVDAPTRHHAAYLSLLAERDHIGLHPELLVSALRDETAELAGAPIDAHLCSNRTCEIGLQEISGAPYASFVLLLERATRPAGGGPGAGE